MLQAFHVFQKKNWGNVRERIIKNLFFKGCTFFSLETKESTDFLESIY